MISVIIPVYNGQRFVEKAIRSVLIQPEVSELIVVNDGSTDGTQIILDKLQQECAILKIQQHDGGLNKGRSASRNLGLAHATGEYIAFLDADDYYLENRFTNDLMVFAKCANCEGVYNAIGAHFYKETTVEQKQQLELYTISESIEPINLFKNLVIGGKGHFSIDGLTMKRDSIIKVGYFNTSLVVGEDTDYMWRLALVANLYPGCLVNPVAIRGVHDANVFDKPALYRENKLHILESLLSWSASNAVPTFSIDFILKHIWILKQKQNNPLLTDIQYWSILFFPIYSIRLTKLSVKYFPVIRYRQKLFSFLYRIKFT